MLVNLVPVPLILQLILQLFILVPLSKSIFPPPGISYLELDISFAGDLPDLEIK